MTIRDITFSLACLAGLGAAAAAAEYVGPATAPPTPTDTIERIPRGAYESTPAAGLPYSSLFRDTGAPYFDSLRNLAVSPGVKLAETVEASGRMDLPDFRGSFPLLQRGFAPEEADLKFGPVYFKLRHLSAAALWSDNIEHSSNDRDSDVIAIMTIGGQIMAQLTEGFRIAVAGNFVYLPTEGEAGFGGFGVRAPYSFGLTANPTAHAQVAWEPVVFGLPVVIADEFTVGIARYSDTAYDGFTFYEGGDFDGRAQARVYTLRAPRRGVAGDEFRERPDRNDFEQTFYANTISLSTGGPLPGDHEFRLRASHTDIWYEDDNQSFPGYVDAVRFSLRSVRENLRFKPFVSYHLYHRDDPGRLSHNIFGGVKGPITDLLEFEGAIGYSWVSDSDSSGLIWRAGLFHQPGPFTRQSLVYARNTSEFLDEVYEHLTYRFHKTLGPDLTATAYAGWNWVEDIDEINPDREELRAGLRFHYIISPRSSFTLLGEYAAIEYDDDVGDTNTWRVRGEYRHRFYDRLTARLIYQYENQDSDRRDFEYYENLVYFALSWYFN